MRDFNGLIIIASESPRKIWVSPVNPCPIFIMGVDKNSGQAMG